MSINSSEVERNLLAERKTREKISLEILENSARWNFALNFCLMKLAPGGAQWAIEPYRGAEIQKFKFDIFVSTLALKYSMIPPCKNVVTRLPHQIIGSA